MKIYEKTLAKKFSIKNITTFDLTLNITKEANYDFKKMFMDCSKHK